MNTGKDIKERQIKFRTWDKLGNRMLYFDFYEIDRENYPWVFDKNRSVIMQFTGTKDKNGKEIYEGDILKCRYMIDYDLFREPEFVEVTFEEGRFRPMTDIKRNQYSNHSYYYDYEVIGNICDEPDFFKKK